MEYQYKYKNLEERKNKIIEAEGQGLRMLHDNFDSDWKRGDEPHGIMIFTDEPELKTEPPENNLLAKIAELEARIEELEG